MSLLSLINFIKIPCCSNVYFIFNVDMNLFSILIKRCSLKYYTKKLIEILWFYVSIFELFSKNDYIIFYFD